MEDDNDVKEVGDSIDPTLVATARLLADLNADPLVYSLTPSESDIVPCDLQCGQPASEPPSELASKPVSEPACEPAREPACELQNEPMVPIGDAVDFDSTPNEMSAHESSAECNCETGDKDIPGIEKQPANPELCVLGCLLDVVGMGEDESGDIQDKCAEEQVIKQSQDSLISMDPSKPPPSTDSEITEIQSEIAAKCAVPVQNDSNLPVPNNADTLADDTPSPEERGHGYQLTFSIVQPDDSSLKDADVPDVTIDLRGPTLIHEYTLDYDRDSDESYDEDEQNPSSAMIDVKQSVTGIGNDDQTRDMTAIKLGSSSTLTMTRPIVYKSSDVTTKNNSKSEAKHSLAEYAASRNVALMKHVKSSSLSKTKEYGLRRQKNDVKNIIRRGAIVPRSADDNNHAKAITKLPSRKKKKVPTATLR